MTTRILITASNVTDQFGRPLLVGQSYSLDDDYARSLVSQLKATASTALFPQWGSSLIEWLAYPEMFGAKGDGSSDDGKAFALALSAPGYAGIKLTPGKNYILKNVPVSSNKVLDFTGATVTWGGSYGTAPVSENVSTLFYVQGTSSSRLNNIRFVGGNIVGSRTGSDYASTGTNEQDGISVQYADNVIFDGCYFYNTKQDCISLDFVTAVVVRGCRFENSGDVAVDIRDGSSISVINNTAVRTRSLVSCKPNIDGVDVIGNDCQTFGIGITCHGPNWHIIGNTIRVATTPDSQDGATENGIECYETGGGVPGNNFNGLVISGNTITGRSSAYGIYIRDSTNGDPSRVMISDNYVSASLGILVAIGTDVVVRGNTVIATTGGGIWINGGTNPIIQGNTVSATTAQAIKSAVTGTVIDGNIISTSSAIEAINLTSASTNTVISSNKITGATSGIITNATGTVISGNAITAANGKGVSLQAADATVQGNKIAATSGEGVLISFAKATVMGNRITAATQGVRVSASNSVVTGNIISGCDFFGVNVSAGAVDTLVVSNNLTNNTSGGSTDAGTTSTFANNK